MKHERLRITPTERRKLQRLSRLRSARAEMVRRARLILMLAEGQTYAAVEQALGCSSPYVTRWKRRFLERRMHGLDSRYVGGQPRVRTAALEAKILEKTRSQPQDGSTHWSTRKLGAELGVSHMMVARVWARAGLQPHRLERYTPNHPRFGCFRPLGDAGRRTNVECAGEARCSCAEFQRSDSTARRQRARTCQNARILL